MNNLELKEKILEKAKELCDIARKEYVEAWAKENGYYDYVGKAYKRTYGDIYYFITKIKDINELRAIQVTAEEDLGIAIKGDIFFITPESLHEDQQDEEKMYEEITVQAFKEKLQEVFSQIMEKVK